MQKMNVLKKVKRVRKDFLAVLNENSYNKRKKKVNYYMSDREKAINLLETIPESKMEYVINILLNLKELMYEEVDPDEMDLAMIEEAKKENDGNGIPIEKLAADLGISL